MNLIDLPSRFFSSRNGQPVRYIVIHTTEGTDSRVWLTQTGSVSAHELLRGEDVYRLVGEGFAAWHAGRIVGVPTTSYFTGVVVGFDDFGQRVWSVNPNYESIGIEVEGFASQRLDMRTCAARVRDIRLRHGAVPIVGHFELSPGDRSDPGRHNLLSLANLLDDEEDDMTPAQEAKLDRLLAIGESLLQEAAANEPLVWTGRAQRSLDVERGTPFDAALPPIDTRIRE